MHPELYAAFYITLEGWWGWVVSHARQLLSLEVTHRTHQQLMWQDLNMIPILPPASSPFPQQQGQALPWQPGLSHLMFVVPQCRSMNLPQLLSAAVDGAGAAAEPLDLPAMGRRGPEAGR